MDNPTYPTTAGPTLRTLRESAGISQDDIAARLGTTRQALRRWENNPALPFVKASKYRAALDAAVTEAAS